VGPSGTLAHPLPDEPGRRPRRDQRTLADRGDDPEKLAYARELLAAPDDPTTLSQHANRFAWIERRRGGLLVNGIPADRSESLIRDR
jgi:hypothetical protein